MSRARTTLAIAAFALMTASCISSESKSVPTGEAIQGSSQDGRPVTDAGVETSAAPEVQQSPLTVFLYGDSEESVAGPFERAQETTRQCMLDQGFEYHPIVHASEVDPNESLKFARTYGFGISTQVWSQEVVGPDLLGMRSPVAEDPNSAYLDLLTDEQRADYDRALHGGSDGYEWDPSINDEDNEAALELYYSDAHVEVGCSDRQADRGDATSKVEQFYEEFSAELQQLEIDYLGDQRLTEIEESVIACVEQGGYFRGGEAIFTDISERLDVIFDGLGSGDAGQPVLSADHLVLLGKIQTYELALAARVLECNHGGLYFETNPDLLDVRADHEQQFLDSNATRLEPFQGAAQG